MGFIITLWLLGFFSNSHKGEVYTCKDDPLIIPRQIAYDIVKGKAIKAEFPTPTSTISLPSYRELLATEGKTTQTCKWVKAPTTP